MLRWIIRLATHGVALAIGFFLGIYTLPILIAPPGPDTAEIEAATANVLFTGRFDPKLPGSDFLHWGDGEVRLMAGKIVHQGRLAPAPTTSSISRASSSTPKKAFSNSRTKPP